MVPLSARQANCLASLGVSASFNGPVTLKARFLGRLLSPEKTILRARGVHLLVDAPIRRGVLHQTDALQVVQCAAGTAIKHVTAAVHLGSVVQLPARDTPECSR